MENKRLIFARMILSKDKKMEHIFLRNCVHGLTMEEGLPHSKNLLRYLLEQTLRGKISLVENKHKLNYQLSRESSLTFATSVFTLRWELPCSFLQKNAYCFSKFGDGG